MIYYWAIPQWAEKNESLEKLWFGILVLRVVGSRRKIALELVRKDQQSLILSEV